MTEIQQQVRNFAEVRNFAWHRVGWRAVFPIQKHSFCWACKLRQVRLHQRWDRIRIT